MKVFAPAIAFTLLSVVYMASSIPYNIADRPQPAGTDFDKLLPLKVGKFSRIGYKDPAPGLDGEATYRSGSGEIFMLFSRADNKADLRETMQTILDEIKTTKTTVARTVDLRTDPSFIHFIGPKIAFFAWTRGLYCFSVDSKNADGKIMDEFMNAFPY